MITNRPARSNSDIYLFTYTLTIQLAIR